MSSSVAYDDLEDDIVPIDRDSIQGLLELSDLRLGMLIYEHSPRFGGKMYQIMSEPFQDNSLSSSLASSWQVRLRRIEIDGMTMFCHYEHRAFLGDMGIVPYGGKTYNPSYCVTPFYTVYAQTINV